MNCELTMQIRQSIPDELDWINEQYASIRFVTSSKLDFIAIAEINGVKAGLGRIVPIEHDVAELGGMYVLPTYRGHSVAGHIIDFLLKNTHFLTVFCLPFAPLEKFYQRFGFERIDSTVVVSKPIAEKLTWCNNNKDYEHPTLLMARKISS